MMRAMKLLGVCGIACVLLVSPSRGETPQEAVRNVLTEQAAAWNRGDLPQFVDSYAEHCTLVGKQVATLTRVEVLAHYREKYPSRAAMGTLTFSNVIADFLDERVATVTGYWHLDRERGAGGAVGGVFSLVLRLDGGKWEILLDHTS